MPARECTVRRPESSERYLGSDRYTKGCGYSAGRRQKAKKILIPDSRGPRHGRHSHGPYQAWATPRQLAAANEAHLGLRLQCSAGLMSAGQKQARRQALALSSSSLRQAQAPDLAPPLPCFDMLAEGLFCLLTSNTRRLMPCLSLYYSYEHCFLCVGHLGLT